MKMCNTTPCAACDTSDFNSIKLLEFPPGIISKPNNHKNRLLFILDGTLSVHAESSEPYLCKKQEVILLHKDKKYSIDALEMVKLLVFEFISPYQVCEKKQLNNAKEIFDSIEYSFHSLPIREPMNLMINTVLNYFNDKVECAYWQKAKQLEVFIIFWNYYSLEELCNFFNPILNKEISFYAKVIANGDKAKTVSELAEMCGYSLTRFNRLFKEHFKYYSPYQWMLQQKIPLIKSRLLDKSVPIKNIVVEFSFIDQSHLNRYCKRYLNATALQIRKNNKYTDI